MEKYFIAGKLHRENSPAVIHYHYNGNIGIEQYYMNGELHREDGPAYIEYYRNGNMLYKSYYRNGNILHVWNDPQGWWPPAHI